MPPLHYVSSLNDVEKALYFMKLKSLGFSQEDDPYLLDESESEKHLGKWSKSAETWPEVKFGDVYMYLIDCPGYTHKSLKAFKSLESYQCFMNGFVHQLYIQHSSTGHCIIQGHVNRSQDISDEPHQAWVGLNSGDASIVTAHCTCMSSALPVCIHVAAIIFQVEATSCTNYSEKAYSHSHYYKKQTSQEIYSKGANSQVEGLWVAFGMVQGVEENSALMSNTDRNLKFAHLVVFLCEKCELAFTDRPLLHTHMKDEHNEEYLKYMKKTVKPGIKIQLKTYITDFNNSSKGKMLYVKKCDMHICKACGLSFKFCSDPLHVHGNHTESQCIKEDLKQKLLEAKRKQKIGTSTTFKDKSFQCTQCSKSFVSYSHLNRHLKTHTRSNEKILIHNRDSGNCGPSHLYTLLTSSSEKPFKCKDCEESFAHSQQLFVHMRSHTKEEPFEFKCNQCEESFRELCHLNTHITTSHSGKKSFLCKICDESFLYSKELQTHMRLHGVSGDKKPEGDRNKKGFSDTSCAFEDNQLSLSDDSLCQGTKNGICSNDSIVQLPENKITQTLKLNKHKCNKCEYSFRTSADLKKHKKTHSQEELSCKCDKCGHSFKNKSGLQSHMKTHIKDESSQCNECGKSFDKRSSLHRHIKTHSREKPFQCSQCDKAYAEKYLLERHKKIHTVDKSFTCHECGKSFKIIYYLRRHMKVHSGEKPFACKECGKVFNSRSNLLAHGRLHTGEKPFLCNECGRRFARSNTLREHMRVHTGEKPYKCKQCGRAFRQSGSLHVHLRWHTRGGSKLHAFRFKCSGCNKYVSHHRIIFRPTSTQCGEEVFDCNECGDTFSQRTTYVAHLRAHTGEMLLPNCTHHRAIGVKSFICDVCGKSFSSSIYRDLHYKLHSGESRYECPTCGKQFVNQMVLRGHLRTHTGEKPFVCTTCGRSFSLVSNLCRHKKIHSGEKPFKCKNLVVKDLLQTRASKHT